MTPSPLFQNNFTLWQPRIAISVKIIKIVTVFVIKKILKTQKMLKESETMYENAVYICIS